MFNLSLYILLYTKYNTFDKASPPVLNLFQYKNIYVSIIYKKL